VVNLRVRLVVREVRAEPPSHAGDSAAEVMLAIVQCQCQLMLVMVLPRQLGRDTMLVSSHAGDDAVEVTWPWRDVSTESCWR
jgi:hypothetical protein